VSALDTLPRHGQSRPIRFTAILRMPLLTAIVAAVQAQTKSTLESIRSMQHRDAQGNIISLFALFPLPRSTR
jgi:hypothetical protein